MLGLLAAFAHANTRVLAHLQMSGVQHVAQVPRMVAVRLPDRGRHAPVSDVYTNVSLLSQCMSALTDCPGIAWCNTINMAAARCLTPLTLSALVC